MGPGASDCDKSACGGDRVGRLGVEALFIVGNMV
jgi:hypothetical protein